MWVQVLSIVTNVFVCIGVIVAILQLAKTNQQLKQSNEQLERTLQQSNEHLERTMEQSNKELQQSNDHLERTLGQSNTVFRADHERRKKQSTIEFYNDINKESFWLTDHISKNFGQKPLAYDAIMKDDELRQSVKRYLSLMERFAVGIECGVYDLHVFNEIAGSSTAKKYRQLHNYIDEVRGKTDYRVYSGFEKLAIKIDEIRENDRVKGTSNKEIQPKDI